MSITNKVYEIIFELLESNPDGIRWVDILRSIKEKVPTIQPKTANGLVWRLLEKYPDKVYKPEKGLFRLLKYKNK